MEENNPKDFLHSGDLLTVSPSPHIKSPITTRSLMLDVIGAMLPALIWGVFYFGWRAFVLIVISVSSCVAFELLYGLIMKKGVTVTDLSCVVTGILIAFNLPVNVPLWIPIPGAAFAIILVKCLFGGLGKNFVNPAIAARIFLFISFPQFLSSFADITQGKLSIFKTTADAVAGATPLSYLKQGELPEIELFDMILGRRGGCIGEVSVLLLAAGGIYLLVRRVITWPVPVCFVGTVALLTFIFPSNPETFNFMLYEVFSGGLFLGAFFMATDYVTCPVTKTGKLIYGTGCGLITVFIRYFGGYPEGVSFAIMIMNLFVWYLDKFTKPVKFGGAAVEKAKQR